MYRSFFEMERMPFVRDVPIQELYESPAMSESLGRLAYAADRQLFAVITADPGCGKSTLLRRFSGSLSKDEYLFLYLSDSKLTPRWFYKSMLDQLGIESKFYRGDAKRQLQKEVEIIRGVQKKKVVCILGEAHLLEKETIEEFRFLLNYRFDSMSPMALILTGQKPKKISYHIWPMPGEGRISLQTGHWTISIKNLPGSHGVSTASAKRA